MKRVCEVWGTTVTSEKAARALGGRGLHCQVRAVVLASSRIGAARAFAAAGFFFDVNAANRHLKVYGSATGNKDELKTCIVEGEVFVASINQGSHPTYLPWKKEKEL